MKHSNYLHPDLCTDEALALVQMETQTPLYKMERENPLFSKESLQTMPGHKWMAGVNMTLVTKDEYPSLLDDLLPKLRTQATTVDPVALPLMDELPLVMGLDLETTGLGKTIRMVGGHPSLSERIVGICIAPTSDDGYYIPVLHNELDGIQNYPYQEALDFLRELQAPDLIMVYHKAAYDREHIECHGITLNPDYIDTFILLDNMGLKAQYFTVGLKLMSEKLLKRAMLEFKDLSGKKNVVPLNYQPAKNISVYGCSDAVNTYGLYQYCMKSDKNPFVVNKFPMRLDTKVNDYTRWMMRHGLPVDYESLSQSLRTTMRRKVILPQRFQSRITDKADIGSPSQVGEFLGTIIFKRFSELPSNSDLAPNALFSKWQIKAKELFKCEVKQKTLKSGVVKTTYSSGDEVLSEYKNLPNATNITWLTEEEKAFISEAASLVSQYRSLVHDIGVFATIYRFAYTDDSNYHRTSVGLKFNGTVTNRYSNESGKGSMARFTFNRGVRKTSLTFKEQDSVCGINLQGINSDPIQTNLSIRNSFKALKLKKAPDDFLKKKADLDAEVEVQLRRYLEGL